MKSPIRGLPGEVRALVGVAFLVALGFGLVAPALPLFAREFGVSRTLAGLVVSAFAATRLVAAPFVGRLVNVVGERRLLGLGITVVAVSSLLAGLAQGYWQLLVLRGAGGVGSTMFSVSAVSLLVRVTPPQQRGRAQGLWAGAFLLGIIAGPAVGTVATFSLRAPFFLYAGTLAVAGTLALGTLRDSPLAARPATGEAASLTLGVALRRPAYRAALLAAFAGEFAIVGARASILPEFVTDELGLGAHWAYAAFLVSSIVSGVLLLPIGRWADRGGRRPVIVAGLVAGTVGYLVLPTLAFAAGLLLAAVLLGVAGAADSVGPGAMLGDIVGGRAGTVVAVFQMAGDLGAVLGPVLAGALADAHGFGTAFVVSAIVCALPVVVLARAPETLVVGESAGAGGSAGERPD